MKAWQDFLKAQEADLGQETVKRWLQPLQVTNFDAGNLYLQARDSFQASWFEEHIRMKAETALKTISGRKVRVHVKVANQPLRPKRRATKAPEKPPAYELRFDELDPHLTLDRFVPSKSDPLPYTLFSNLCSASLKSRVDLAAFNPIYLHGEPGCGKTHLLMALAHGLRALGKRVLYVRAETFTEHVVRAIRSGEMQLFRDIYRKQEALLIDDVQILRDRAATQEELFHTFNHLHLQGCQLVLSSTRAPGELESIEPRLVSRFEWGVVLFLTSARELRKALLAKKAEALNVELHPDLVDFLVSTFTSSTHSLIQALKALVLRAHLQGEGQVLHAGHAKSCLADLAKAEERQVVSGDTIIERVAAFYGLARADLLGSSQKRECSGPRQVAMYLCRSALAMPYPQIGRLFGRDHSTVMSGVRKVEKRLASHDHELAAELKGILREIQSLPHLQDASA